MADKREQCKSCKLKCPQEIFQAKLNKGRIPFNKCMDFTLMQTNVDRIRNMSDKDLADFLYCIEAYCDDGEYKKYIDEVTLNDSKDDILEWLQSEVEGE